MAEYLLIDEFLAARHSGLLLDARSEKEFEQGHIKGAINIPLLNNEHRHLVGTAYKQKGREFAVELGFELAGPLFAGFIKNVKSLTDKKTVFLYCWRGGMRSGIMSWILSMSGYKTVLLKGGYKTYRNFVLQKLDSALPFVVISGKTGSGKTAILHELKAIGEQVLDLERLAHHRGSAFGQIGLPPQPTNEQFENLIAEEIVMMNPGQAVFVEGESHTIGKNKIPDCMFDRMQKAPMIEVEAGLSYRLKRILDEYGKFPEQELSDCTKKLSKRLGDQRMREAVEALMNGDKQRWLEILMQYYDNTYAHSISVREPFEKKIIQINDDEDPAQVARRIQESRIYNFAR